MQPVEAKLSSLSLLDQRPHSGRPHFAD